MFEKYLAISKEAPPKSKVSSTNRAWLIGSTPTDEVMPGMIPTFFHVVSFLLKKSAIRIYKNGERPFPIEIKEDSDHATWL